MSKPNVPPSDQKIGRPTLWLYMPDQPTDPLPEGLHVQRTGHVFSIASSEYETLAVRRMSHAVPPSLP